MRLRRQARAMKPGIKKMMSKQTQTILERSKGTRGQRKDKKIRDKAKKGVEGEYKQQSTEWS